MKEAITKFMDGAIEAIASIRAGFLFAFFGMLAQVTHIWLLAYDFSSFTGIGANIQAWILSIFLGGGLLFFTIRAGDAKDYLERERYDFIANAFAVFEAFINLYYWGNKLVFEPGFKDGVFNADNVSWYKLFLAIPFAISIPVILKQYAGEIKLKHEIKEEGVVIKELAEMENAISILTKQINEFSTDFKKHVEQTEENYNSMELTIDELKENQQKSFPILANFDAMKKELQNVVDKTSGMQPIAPQLPTPRTKH